MTTTSTTKRRKRAAKPDIYRTVTDQLIAALEAGAAGDQWRAPWHGAGTLTLPSNAETGNAYRGANVFLLWAAQAAQGYPTGVWATYNAWKRIGAQVRAGEKHHADVWVWKQTSRKVVDEETGEEGRRKSLYAASYAVFNAAQVDGWTPPETAVPDPFATIAHAEAWFQVLDADVRHGGNRAYYTPAADRIQLPAPEAFATNVDYYATRAHETVHWTGHESRCNRDLTNRFGTAAYAAEELIAEIGAAYVCATLGLSNEPRPDHAQYVASWLRLLRDDPKAIITAASKAQAAVDWLAAHAEPAEEVAA